MIGMQARAALLAVFLVLCCARRTEEQKLVSSLSAAKSWMATLPFVAEQWLGNRVPDAYTRRCLDSADKEIRKGLQSIERSRASAELRDRLHRALDRAAVSTSSVKRALDVSDRAAVARETARFESIHEELDSIGKAYEP